MEYFSGCTVGSIPILGDIFDLTYRANRRNFNLLKEHYDERKHTGSAWPVILFVGLVLGLLFVLLVWLLWKIASYGFGVIF